MSVFIAGGAHRAMAARPRFRRHGPALDHCGDLHRGVRLRARARRLLGWLLIAIPTLFYVVVFVFGAAMLPLYSLSMAHANDRLPRAEFVEASAGLLMINAATSIPGPCWPLS